MAVIKCNETKWDWEVEYDKLKANSLEHLENLKKYLESVAPVPEKGWDNAKALRDIHSKIFDAVKEAQARDPQGWKAAMTADNSHDSWVQRMLGKPNPAEAKKKESLTPDEEIYWYDYWADRVRDRLAKYPGESGIIDENCKMLSDTRQMWGVAAQAKELCDAYPRYLSYRGYTNRMGSPFSEISWSAKDAAALAKALGPKQRK